MAIKTTKIWKGDRLITQVTEHKDESAKEVKKVDDKKEAKKVADKKEAKKNIKKK